MSSSKPVTYNSVTIHLFEAKDLAPMDRNGFSDPFVKFRLGGEKFRSRVIKKTLNPQWMEQFDIFFYDYDSKRLEISLWDWDRTMKNELIGRVDLDLTPYEQGKTYDLWLDVKDKGKRRGTVHLSVLVNEAKEINDFARIVKTQASVEPLVDDGLPPSQTTTPTTEEALLIRRNPGVGLVGSLSVKILTTSNLPMTDSEGKSLYCVLQLGLVRAQTFTIPKSADAEWNFEHSFPVDDIHAVLEITVMDRDSRSRSSVLGSLALPLVHMEQSSGLGVRRTWTLKDKKLMKNTASTVVLELKLGYDVFRAALQTLRPKEEVPSELDKKVSSQVLVNKVHQIRKVVSLASESLTFSHSLLTWDSPPNSVIAYLVFLVTTFFFQPFWIPLGLLLLFLKNYTERYQYPTGNNSAENESDEDADSLYSSGSTTFSEASTASCFSAKFTAAEELLQLTGLPNSVNPLRLWSRYMNRSTGRQIVSTVKTAHDQARFIQTVLEFFAEQYEKVVNTFNFTVPWLSYFAILALTALLAALYVLPLRWVVLAWGTWEFGKGFCGVRGFELLAFLSRVHTRHEAKMYAETASS
ncbi:Multiple C2 and transmembrane domain-containing protein 1 [Hypsibius exemplaris]|uniref:Multiple C2 and transmembrane domain-containing protein 1 n=1 Tax=Hypsibius exemplaris TaxID=2072580 RepID=A0A9X6RKS5_HYPEX|nr:Multiple C2 and transmembrane domain-containing protein 1 [Hypsibius exemplaris]